MKTKYARVLLTLLDAVYKEYPHISVKIESYWGTRSGHMYMKYLLVKDRPRQGLQFTAYRDIITLYLLHTSIFGNFDSPVTLDNLNINLDELEALYEGDKSTDLTKSIIYDDSTIADPDWK